jgi:hypothetical protein
MKCANCDKNALFMYRMTRNKALYYCGKDLPKFLEERRRAGLLAITEEFTKEKELALEILSPSTPESVEDPTPKVKKTTKKSVK